MVRDLTHNSELCLELKKNFVLLEKAAVDKDFRMAGVLTKNLKSLRKAFSLCDVLLVLKFYLPELHTRLSLSAQPSDVPTGSTIDEHLHCKQERAEALMRVPETQLFLYVLLQMKLIDDGDLKTVSVPPHALT